MVIFHNGHCLCCKLGLMFKSYVNLHSYVGWQGSRESFFKYNLVGMAKCNLEVSN
jgi:hypothetical protein